MHLLKSVCFWPGRGGCQCQHFGSASLWAVLVNLRDDLYCCCVRDWSRPRYSELLHPELQRRSLHSKSDRGAIRTG